MNNDKGVVGIYVHGLKGFDQKQVTQGKNPFDALTMKKDGKKLSSIVKAYNPPYFDSKQVYAYISSNLAAWFEEAIKIRKNY